MTTLIVIVAVLLLAAAYVCPVRAQTLEVLQMNAADISGAPCDFHKGPWLYCCRPSQGNETPSDEIADSQRPLFDELHCRCLAMQSTSEVTTTEFAYELTLRNLGSKTVSIVEWEYIFTDPETRAEVGRHQFLSEGKISPGERKTLVAYSTSPPTRVVSIRMLAQPDVERFGEKVTI
ncbi:MAG TPA: hypothetical protein VJ180_09390, partial [Pyrinomonadaceae bacterium]|nr:hypothetical protein [Pyrinomonadaceae bacterium]